MATTDATDVFPAVSYTDDELASYLPAGWTLAASPAPNWDEKKATFRCTVIDGSDLAWPLAVGKDDADRHGRIEALRRAIDALDRGRFKSFL
jgi:hypothetical protein